MRRAIELKDVECAVIDFENGSFVAVRIAIIWRREYCNHRREAGARIRFVDLVASRANTDFFLYQASLRIQELQKTSRKVINGEFEQTFEGTCQDKQSLQ